MMSFIFHTIISGFYFFDLKKVLNLESFSFFLFQVLGTGEAEIDTWEMGLVELLYCDRKDAKQLFNCGRNNKVSPGKSRISMSQHFWLGQKLWRN